MQSLIYELAHAAGKDPVQFRLALLDAPPPAAAGGRPGTVRSGTHARRPEARGGIIGLGPARAAEGYGDGVGIPFRRRGYFAEVAEVRMTADSSVRVNEVSVAGGLGNQIINPSGEVNDVQGTVTEGLSHLMSYEISIERGRVVQTNFHEYQPVRFTQAPPEIEVYFVKTDNAPTGLGEPALPPVLPAVCNAVFAVTGKRALQVRASRFRSAARHGSLHLSDYRFP
jgi:isoquinoline 1-oxidoreductase subunit beta